APGVKVKDTGGGTRGSSLKKPLFAVRQTANNGKQDTKQELMNTKNRIITCQLFLGRDSMLNP
ncbi:MAG: hypothetical protein LBT76_06660, partial [Tannerella sp.]|nr:hypothetical protein [Tannerella sp.]